MQGYRTLPADLILLMLDTEEDQITSQMESRISGIKRTPCPRCGSSLHPAVHPTPFNADDPLPRMMASCECGYAHDPQTKIVVDLGSAAKVKDPLPIIRPSED